MPFKKDELPGDESLSDRMSIIAGHRMSSFDKSIVIFITVVCGSSLAAYLFFLGMGWQVIPTSYMLFMVCTVVLVRWANFKLENPEGLRVALYKYTRPFRTTYNHSVRDLKHKHLKITADE